MNTVKIIKKQQVVCGITIEINQVIFFLLILNLLNIKQGREGGNPIPNPDYHVNRAGKNETEVIVLLKHLSNFWRSLDMPLINCEVEIILTWSKKCALADMTVRAAGNNNDPSPIVAPTGLEFQITDTKLYVSVVTLSKENDIKLLEKLKSEFKRTIRWKKYRSQMTIQNNNNNNLNYLIDPTFTNVNRLFVLSLKRIEEDNIKKTAEILSHIIMYQTYK